MNDNIDPTLYTRMFKLQAKELFLASFLFLQEYQKYGAIIVATDDTWTSYLPNDSVKRTLDEGYKLLSDKGNFKQYVADFNQYKERAGSRLEAIVSLDELEQGQLKEALSLIGELWRYYQKTEFFFVDKATAEMDKNVVIKENLNQFEKVKNSGREFLNRVIFTSDSYFSRLLDLLERQFDIKTDILLYYSRDELSDLFKEVFINDETIQQRRKSFVIKGLSDSFEIVVSNEADLIIERFGKISESGQKELKGTVANKGLARGKAMVMPFSVREIFDNMSHYVDQMNQGDILVAETTSPEFIPMIKKAGAIVTNQGGIMSHAAISSRELGIPCIVGIPEATERLSTGDNVEVDANSGVIRIISTP